MHVLILGARAPAALEWARACRAAGWRVTAADSVRWPVTRASCAIDGYVRLPEPRRDPTVWINTLARVVKERSVDLVVPTCEEVFYLAHGSQHLPCRVLASDFATLRKLHHKSQFARMTVGWPVQAPESRLIDTPNAAQALATEPGEWVLKPAYSRFGSRVLIQPRRAALARLRPTPARPWVAQRYVAGHEHCSYSLMVEGRLTAHACYHPRYRVGRGSAIWFEPTDPRLVREFVEHFGAMTGYSGQVGFDFIETPDGRCHVLECNPRATSGVHLFADQPRALAAALVGNNGGEVLRPTGTPYMVALAMWLFAAPRFALRPRFWRDLTKAHDVISRYGDRAPLPAQAPGLLEIAGRALVRRCGLIRAATADIEWDGDSLDGGP